MHWTDTKPVQNTVKRKPEKIENKEVRKSGLCAHFINNKDQGRLKKADGWIKENKSEKRCLLESASLTM